jgi:hypothetical protein
VHALWCRRRSLALSHVETLCHAMLQRQSLLLGKLLNPALRPAKRREEARAAALCGATLHRA